MPPETNDRTMFFVRPGELTPVMQQFAADAKRPNGPESLELPHYLADPAISETVASQASKRAPVDEHFYPQNALVIEAERVAQRCGAAGIACIAKRLDGPYRAWEIEGQWHLFDDEAMFDHALRDAGAKHYGYGIEPA
jgi:hypothetical protein